LSFLLKFDQTVVLEFGDVIQNLRWMAINGPGECTDTFGVMLGDRLQ
jgi:hypothetical protein